MKEPDDTFYRQHVLYDDRVQECTTRLPPIDWRYATFLSACRSEQSKTLLDIGCGEGGFMSLARGHGFDVYGLDRDERAVAYAKTHHHLEHVVCGRWETLHALADWKHFDVITMFETLEHVASPVSLMDTAYALLKSGGSVILTVPRLDRRPAMFDPEVDYPPHHLTLWTAKALTRLLQTRGFVGIQVIRKPLAADDVMLHLRWRIRRLVGRAGTSAHGRGSDMSSGRECSLSDRWPVRVRLIATTARYVLSACVWLLRVAGVARGHTLVALATRPG